jgi:hypothetical protein
MSVSKKGWDFVKLGHFPASCLVAYNMTHKELCSALKRRKYPDWVAALEGDERRFEDNTCYGMWRSAKRGNKTTNCFFILLKDYVKLNDFGYTLIAHEVLHVVQFVSEFVSANVIEEKESSAYLHSHLMTETIKIVRSAK